MQPWESELGRKKLPNNELCTCDGAAFKKREYFFSKFVLYAIFLLSVSFCEASSFKNFYFLCLPLAGL